MIEWCDDIIGTVHMISPKLFEKVGYLWQPSQYGWDDCLMCLRSTLSGFRNAFYPLIEIEHIDTKPNPYWEYKRKITHLYWNKFEEAKDDFISGKRPIYYNPFLKE
jgi:GT2 family glycosyltransferase